MNEAYKALNELNNSIYYRRADSLPKFARLYVQETSTNNWTNLLYLETTNYLLREVGMIPSNIIENPALQSLAKTLRYFIRERKYGYADDIRNARKNSRDFEETIAKMLREGELRRVQQEQDRQAGKEVKNWIYLPNEEEIKEVFRLANEDFESTKLALVMLAFSFPPKGTEEDIK
jgi:CRISPR type I-A-associated protein Csa5